MIGLDDIERDAIKRETRLVLLTLKILGLTDSTSRVHKAGFAPDCPMSRLTFEGFRSVFWNMPIYLTYENLYKLMRHTSCVPGKVLTKPQVMIPAQKYEECLLDASSENGGRPVGMIFPYDQIKGGLIMHNADFLLKRSNSDCQVRWNVNGQPRCIERYASVLRYLHNCGWQSGIVEQTTQAFSLSPIQLMQIVRDPSALRIILFMNELTSLSPSISEDLAAASAEIIREQHRRWICVKQKDMALKTGLTHDQVKRAVAWLTKGGLINVEKQGRLNYYCINTDSCYQFLKDWT
jgi:DNA-binding transcriptional ArsR family regulator